MNQSFNSMGSLGEFFPDKEIPCMIKGCKKTWTWYKKDQTPGTKAPKKMCPDCEARLAQLQDKELSCAASGCDKKRIWSKMDQLQHECSKGKKVPPPAGYCPECQGKIHHPKDMDVACKLKECSKTWVWTKDNQKRAQTLTPPERLCESCFQQLQQFEDKIMKCKVHSCEETWVYNKMQQLVDRVKGKDENYVPKRMCRKCLKGLKQYEEKEVTCKIRECGKTWAFTPYSQLEYYTRAGADAKVPDRMCNDCYTLMQQAEEREINCKNKGCNHTWKYTKSMQLHDKLTNRKYPFSRMCPECLKGLKLLEDQKIECCHKGCEDTWTLTAYDQLLLKLKGREDIPQKPCTSCRSYLSVTQPQTVKCKSCEEEMTITSYQQLMQKLGVFTLPEKCATCVGKELAESRGTDEVTIIKHSHVVQIPHKGPWNKDQKIAELPKYINHNKIASLVDVDVVIVAFGDDLTFGKNEENNWPSKLEEMLNENHPELKSVVVNAGIPDTNSIQAYQRLARDVKPFKPVLTIFSLSHGDSLIRSKGKAGFEIRSDYEQLSEAMEKVCQELSKLDGKAVYWTPPPILVNHNEPSEIGKQDFASWSTTQQISYSKCVAHAEGAAKKFDIPVLDLRARFEVNGETSAQKWMEDWCRPNETGITRMTQWFYDYIRTLEIYK